MNKKTYQYGVLFVGIFLLASSVLAETWTINDDGITGSTSGTLFDFTDSFVSVDNATFTNNITVDGRLLDTTDFDAWDVANADGYSLNGTIQNSNGNSFALSEAGLTAALADASPGGVVYLPVCDITLTSDLNLDDVELHGSGCGHLRYWGATHPYDGRTELKLGAGITITMTNCSKLQDVFVNCTNAHTVTAIHILAHNVPWWDVPNVLSNVIVNKYWQGTASGIGVNISSIHDGTSIDGGHIAYCSFNSVCVRGFDHGLVLYAKEADATYVAGYTNSNTFNDWTFMDCKHSISFKVGSGNEPVVRGNTFSNIHIHSSTHFVGGWGINVTDERNMFTNIEVMDWDVSVENGYALLINGTTKVYAQGFFAGDVGYAGASNYYIMDINTCDAITD